MTSPVIDRKMATPPIRGTGMEWTLRMSGVSTILRRLARQITTGVVMTAKIVEPRYTER
jgi:hypothetical protein